MKKQTSKKLSLGKLKIASLSQSKQEMLKGGEALFTFEVSCRVLCITRPCTTPPPPDQFR